MCLLTVFPAGQVCTDQHEQWLAEGCDRNPDGFGWAIVAGTEILTGRHSTPQYAIDRFREARAEHPQGPALFHSRIGTAGPNNIDNTHPFPVGGDTRTILAHNGILPEYLQPNPGDLRSDTRILADEFLPSEFRWTKKLRNLEALDSPAWRRWFRKEVLRGDKVAFLTVDPRYRKRLYIVGAGLGHWARNVWWSNSSYVPWVPAKVGYGSSGAGKQWWQAGSTGWVKDEKRGIWRIAGGGDEACDFCAVIGSVGSDGQCRWCDSCNICLNSPCVCGAADEAAVSRPPVSYLDQLTDEQLAAMSEEEFERYLATKATR